MPPFSAFCFVFSVVCLLLSALCSCGEERSMPSLFQPFGYSPASERMISPAISIPATGGTKETEAGACRPDSPPSTQR